MRIKSNYTIRLLTAIAFYYMGEIEMRRNLFRTIVSTAVMIAAGLIGSVTFAQETTTEIPSVIVIKNVNVWDGTSDTLQRDTDVLIVGDKIKKVAKGIPTGGAYEVNAVRKTSKKLAGGTATGNFLKLSVADEKGKVEKVSVKVRVIDGKGGYLIPGLIDSHLHWTDRQHGLDDQQSLESKVTGRSEM